MKIGELYDMAKGYLPHVTPTIFTHFYNLGLSKITNDIRVIVETDNLTMATYPTSITDVVKIIQIKVDDENCPRLIGGTSV